MQYYWQQKSFGKDLELIDKKINEISDFGITNDNFIKLFNFQPVMTL